MRPEEKVNVEQLSSAAVAQFLAASGWSRVGTMKSGAEQWRYKEESLLLPHDPKFSDYDWMLSRAVATLAKAEHEKGANLTVQLENVDADVIRITLDDVRPKSNVPLSAALAALTGVRDALEAAARAVVDRLGLSRSRADSLVRSVSSAADLAAAELGSLVLPIVIPLNVPYLAPASSDAPNAEPIGRQVVTAFADSMRELEAAAYDEKRQIGEWVRETRVIPALWQAVAKEGERHLEVSITWSRLTPSSPMAEPITFDAASVARLMERAPSEREAVYRYAPRLSIEPEEPIEYRREVVGKVRTLSRPRVTVKGDVGGRSRSVWAYLSAAEYKRAMRAHAADIPVRITGTIQVSGRRTPRFLEVDEFEVLD